MQCYIMQQFGGLDFKKKEIDHIQREEKKSQAKKISRGLTITLLKSVGEQSNFQEYLELHHS